ncbi:MAG: MBL fold metallo-hydrolase [Clostridia bacterium]|nr:MBL fold metallo-hydrolase [Clostridia bacterium]
MPKRITKKRLFYLLCALAAALAAAATSTVPDTPENLLSITFIDVGQGDSTLIRTPEDITLLIDGGEYDAYQESLAPFLSKNGISDIDYALVSHYHSDHLGGISKLLEKSAIDTLIIPEYDDKNNSRERLVKKAQQASVKIEEVSAGDTINLGTESIKVSVLHPKAGGFSIENENSNSIVLRLDCFDETFLLTGDLEADAEASLIKEYDLEADVLKVGHHGSSTSTSDAFLEAVDPTYAVIEAGKNNRYGHPHYEVLDRLENDDVRVYRTDLDGDITFKVSENGIESISTERGVQSNGN